MAFLEKRALHHIKERFSLLLLDPGETYIKDFNVHLTGFNGISNSNTEKGRLKLCSRSLLFDPANHKLPIIKLSFKMITKIVKGGKSGREDIIVNAKECTLMKENNMTQPYVFIRESKEYQFSLLYTRSDECLHVMQQLHRAASLPHGEQTAMLDAVIKSMQSRIPFNDSWLECFKEDKLFETIGERVAPLVLNPGIILVTSSIIYFQSFNNIDPLPVIKIKLKYITRVIKRRFLLRQIGLEIISTSGHHSSPYTHLYLSLPTTQQRDAMYDTIIAQPDVKEEDYRQENMMLRWQNRVISNYEYLEYLNSMSDRSTNDLTQYPVYPWIIADQASITLDLTNPKTFRDLSKPIGALNPDRLGRLKKRYAEMPEKPFLYGSHYSSPGYVLFFLSRIAPEYVLCLQNGRFDYPDRMFNSIEKAWENCLKSNTDFKELIPEFYSSNGDFLLHNPLVDFGHCEDGKAVHDVQLPPWAHGARDYITKLREALECDYVSDRLHQWIDLIFGYKQQGDEALQADNVFYYLTYEGAVDIEMLSDPNERAAQEAQIMEFGQTPKQLFTKPHPRRRSHHHVPSHGVDAQLPSITPSIHNMTAQDPHHNTSSLSADCADSTEDINANHDSTNAAATQVNQQLTNQLTEDYTCIHSYKLHRRLINDVHVDNNNVIYSVSSDCTCKLYSYDKRQQLHSANPITKPIQACAVLEGTDTVILACDCSLVVYNTGIGVLTDEQCIHDNTVTALCLDDDYLVSASLDSTVKLWFIDRSKKQTQLVIMASLEHDTGVCCTSLRYNSDLLASGTEEGELCVWNVSTQYSVFSLHVHNNKKLSAVQLNKEGCQIVSVGHDGCILVFDVATATILFKHEGDIPLSCLLWDDRLAVIGDQSGSFHVWNMNKGTAVKSFSTAHQGAISCVFMNAQYFITGGEDGSVCVWNKIQH